MTTGRINQVSASPPTPAKSGTQPKRAQPSQKQWFALSESKSKASQPSAGAQTELARHTSVLLTPSRAPAKHRGPNWSSPYAQTGVKGQPEGCKLPRRKATQRVLVHKLPAACADSALAYTQDRPRQLRTRFGGSRSDGL